MDKTLVYIFVSLAVISTLLLASQIDDDLSDEAIILINKLEIPGNSEAYLYLLGIYANEDDDPIVLGRQLLKESGKRDVDEGYELVEYQDSKKLPLPDGELFCSFQAEGCIDTFFSKEFVIEEMLKKHRVLINRSKIFSQFSEYKTLTKPIIYERIAPHKYLIAAERISILNAISKHKQGHTAEAIKLLVQQFSSLRKVLGLQDTLVGKLVCLTKLSEIIDVASIILTESKNVTVASFIPKLTQTERSLDTIVIREFGMSYFWYKDIHRMYSLMQWQGKIQNRLFRIVYKPNMTINSIVPFFNRIARLATLSPTEFVQETKLSRELEPEIPYFRNYLGHTFAWTAAPNYDQYIARFIDLETKLVLFNQRHHFRKSYKSAENPYYQGEPPEITGKQVCFSGPLEDNFKLRCLRIKI